MKARAIGTILRQLWLGGWALELNGDVTKQSPEHCPAAVAHRLGRETTCRRHMPSCDFRLNEATGKFILRPQEITLAPTAILEMTAAQHSNPDPTLTRTICGLIGAERDRRQTPTALAFAQIVESSPAGSSRLSLALDGQAAHEYESRAKEWLAIAKRIVYEGGYVWTRDRVITVGQLIRKELVHDSDQFIRKRARGPKEPSVQALEAAMNRIEVELGHKLDLLVISEDQSRIPVVEQLQASRYAAVLVARRKAHTFSDGSRPDYHNAAKEAVSAVEQLARIVTGKPEATLGEAINEIRRSQRVQAPLLKGIEEIWGWASNAPGVRHGSAPRLTVDETTARYILKQCDAAMLLLLSSDGEA